MKHPKNLRSKFLTSIVGSAALLVGIMVPMQSASAAPNVITPATVKAEAKTSKSGPPGAPVIRSVKNHKSNECKGFLFRIRGQRWLENPQVRHYLQSR